MPPLRHQLSVERSSAVRRALGAVEEELLAGDVERFELFSRWFAVRICAMEDPPRFIEIHCPSCPPKAAMSDVGPTLPEPNVPLALMPPVAITANGAARQAKRIGLPPTTRSRTCRHSMVEVGGELSADPLTLGVDLERDHFGRVRLSTCEQRHLLAQRDALLTKTRGLHRLRCAGDGALDVAVPAAGRDLNGQVLCGCLAAAILAIRHAWVASTATAIAFEWMSHT